MIRLIVLFAAIAVTAWAVQMLRKPHRRIKRHPPNRGGDMVKCAHCGLHLPSHEAICAAGRSFCSVEHRDRHLSDTDAQG